MTDGGRVSWRDIGPKRERGLCAHGEWGSWSGELYVCDKRAGTHNHRGYDPREMRRATPDENRRYFAAMSAPASTES